MSLFSLPVIDAPVASALSGSRAANSLGYWNTASGRIDRGDNRFSNILDGALTEVSRLQGDVSRAQASFQIGAPGASLEATMVSMQKAQLAFTSALTVRNRLVSAYTDIMNMPV